MRIHLEGLSAYIEPKSCKTKEFQTLVDDATSFQQACLSGSAEKLEEVMTGILGRWAPNFVEKADDLTVSDVWNILVAKAGPLGENINMLPRLSVEAMLDFLSKGGWETVGVDVTEMLKGETEITNGDG